MVNFQKFKRFILFYKEYILITIASIVLFIWILAIVGLDTKSQTQTSDTKIVSSIAPEGDLDGTSKYILPKPILFVNSVNEYGGIDKEEFIKLYKEALKDINVLKGAADITFSFYNTNYKTTSVKILIQWKELDGKKIINKQTIKLKVNSK